MGETIYLVTGAAGFLGSHVCDELLERGDKVRALVLPGDKSVKYVPKAVEIVEGNLCDVDSLETFFTIPQGDESIVIHCASMVTTNAEFNQKLIDVNVGGTKNMIAKCLEHAECKKMVYVSSTGAIPELPGCLQNQGAQGMRRTSERNSGAEGLCGGGDDGNHHKNHERRNAGGHGRFL